MRIKMNYNSDAKQRVAFTAKKEVYLRENEIHAIIKSNLRNGNFISKENRGGTTMANKVGSLIKKARTEAGLTQEQLAKKVKNTSTSDIGKAERGELKLTQEQLKQIAKATGVTQKSLLDAAASSSYKSSSAGKKTTTEKKTSTNKKTSSSKKTSGSSSSGSSMKVSSTERRLVELYREADTSVKKKAMEILKENQPVTELQGTIESLIDGAIGLFTNR